MKFATVKGKAMVPDGNIIVTLNDNHILNLIFYDVELPDGVVKQYVANTISDNMYTQVDQYGHS